MDTYQGIGLIIILIFIIISRWIITASLRYASWVNFLFRYYSDQPVNKFSGTINGHTIEIQDWHNVNFFYRRIYTRVTVDGKQVKGTITLGASFLLSSQAELRTLLQSLRTS